MKKATSFGAVAVLLVIIVMMAALPGCCGQPRGPESIEQQSKLGQVLFGDHQLRRIFTDENDKADIFMFSTNNGVMTATFSWQMNDGMWAISTLPIDKLRVNFSESSEPSVKFCWRRSLSVPAMEEIMGSYVSYAVITISERDWPIKLQM